MIGISSKAAIIRFHIQMVLRNILKRPFLNMVKIVGMTLALTGVILIVLLIKYELSFDRFNSNPENIYRLTVTNPEFIGGKHFARTYNTSYMSDLKAKYPDIKNYVRLSRIGGGVLKLDDKYVKIKQAYVCDSTFFEMFNAPLIIGDKSNILAQPGSMILTESFAKKVFGKENPIGKTLTIPLGQYYGEETNFTIKGIMKDFPQNSHFHPELITTSVYNYEFNGWGWTYLLIAENSNIELLEQNISNVINKKFKRDEDDNKRIAHLQKLTQIHLNSHKLREMETNSNMMNIYVLSIAAIMLLSISMANYASLNLGMSQFSYKFLKTSNILGSSKRSIFNYFMIESIIGTIITLSLTFLVLFPVNIWVQKYFNLYLFSSNLKLIIIISIIFSFLVILTGILPFVKNIILRTFSFIGKSEGFHFNNNTSGKTMIVVQYAFSVILIVAVLVISIQTRYALKNSIGVEENNVLCMEKVHQGVQKNFELFKEELLSMQAETS